MAGIVFFQILLGHTQTQLRTARLKQYPAASPFAGAQDTGMRQQINNKLLLTENVLGPRTSAT